MNLNSQEGSYSFMERSHADDGDTSNELEIINSNFQALKLQQQLNSDMKLQEINEEKAPGESDDIQIFQSSLNNSFTDSKEPKIKNKLHKKKFEYIFKKSVFRHFAGYYKH